MSPASYQTAPPRNPMLTAVPPSRLPRRAGRRAGLRSFRSPELRERLLDRQLSGLDLSLVPGQVTGPKQLLGPLEMLPGLGEQLGHGSGGRLPRLLRRLSRLLGWRFPE